MIVAVCMKGRRHWFCSSLFETCSGASAFCFICFGNIGHKKQELGTLMRLLSVVGRLSREQSRIPGVKHIPSRINHHVFLNVTLSQ